MQGAEFRVLTFIRVAGRRELIPFQGSGFRVQGSWFRVQGAGGRGQGAGCRVQGSWCRVQGAGCRHEPYPIGQVSSTHTLSTTPHSPTANVTLFPPEQKPPAGHGRHAGSGYWLLPPGFKV